MSLSAFGRACAGAPNQIKAIIAPFVGVSDVAMLAQGAPPPCVFPVRAITLELSNGETVRIDSSTVVDAQAYQYARSGYAPLLAWCDTYFRKIHRPPSSEIVVALHAGATDAIAKLAEVLFEGGDIVLTEQFTWSTAMDGMRARGIVLEGIDVDVDGIVPEALSRVCTRLALEGLHPKAIYIVPNGSNPCGTTLASERFQKIYDICAHFHLLIIEDDPYIWLWLSLDEGEEQGPCMSFASLDTRGIVVRIDSFSKCIAPGFRLGWLAGPKGIVDAFNGSCSTSTHNGCPLSMVALHALLEHWGESGLKQHLDSTRAEYRRRMHVVLAAAHESLQGLATLTRPRAGMFLWLDLSPSNVVDSSMLMPALRKQRVLAIPSVVFSPTSTPSAHMRISFSQASDEDLQLGVSRLAAVLREHRLTTSPAG